MQRSFVQLLMSDGSVFYTLKSLLFRFNEDDLEFYGYYTTTDKGQVNIMQDGPGGACFAHNDYITGERSLPHKKTILYCVSGTHVLYQTRLFCEYMTSQYNVVILGGDRMPDIFINDVMYCGSESKNIRFIDSLDIEKIYTETSIFFSYFFRNRFRCKVYYVHHRNKIRSHEIHLPKNFMSCINHYIFTSIHEMEYFSSFHDIPLENQKLIVQPFGVKNLGFSGELKKEKRIISYDLYTDDTKKILKKFPGWTLVLFTNKGMKPEENVEYIKRYQQNFVVELRRASIYFTAETKDYTDFHIHLAKLAKAKCFVPLYFRSLDGVEFYDTIDDIEKHE